MVAINPAAAIQYRSPPIREDDPPLNDGRVSCLAPPLRSGAKQLGAVVYVQRVRGTTRASLVPPLRSGTKLAFALAEGL
jgi:hypothetical protein